MRSRRLSKATKRLMIASLAKKFLPTTLEMNGTVEGGKAAEEDEVASASRYRKDVERKRSRVF